MGVKKLLTTLIVLATIFLISCQTQTTPTNTVPTGNGGQDQGTPGTSQNGNVSSQPYDTSKGFTDENGCYDSEGGKFYDKRGYITDAKGQRYEDKCLSDSSLTEVYCNQIGYKAEDSTTCEFGCMDGQCLKSSSAINQCTDSDFKDYYNKGSVTYQTKVTFDSCKDTNTLIEQICTSVGIPAQDERFCSAGCTNGACNSETTTDTSNCVDSDYGDDAEFVKGTVTDPKGTETDTCLNSYTVKEWRCGQTGFRAYNNIECLSNKCVDGACTRS